MANPFLILEEAFAWAASPQGQRVINIIQHVDWKDALEAIQTHKVTLPEVEQTAEVALSIAGVFFPPAAMAAEDLQMLSVLINALAHASSNVNQQSPHLSVLPGPPLWVR